MNWASIKDLLARFRTSRAGASAALFAILLPVAIGMAALVIDINHARVVRKAMQTSADAAALAASMDIGTATNPISTATTYSAASGGKNVIPGVSVSMVSTYPKLACINPQTTYGLCTSASPSLPTGAQTACDGLGGCNVIYVKETATVQTIFSRIFGLNGINLTVSAAAAGHGGSSKELDVVLILDTTGSMSSNDPACGSTRLACAEAGAKTLMQTLNPAYDSIAIMVFPGLTSTTYANYDSSCQGGSVKSGDTAAYSASPVYLVAPSNQSSGPLTDYWTSTTDNTLNQSSALVKTVGYAGCSGVANPGGQGTFYGDVVTAAQSYLSAHGRTAAQKVIILLSDGDASSGSATYGENECGQAVQSAAAVKATGTVVYTIGYGAPSSGCSTDNYTSKTSPYGVASSAYKINGILVPPYTTPCTALGAMATDSAHFFYDGTPPTCSGGQSAGTLQNAFKQIGNQLMAPILFPYS